ncbi:MAG: oligosaccharide flippase family protein [Calditrichae bacterium]|nr:oligosaccharide flippase family protein [Calditrichia bacterium]
MKEIKKSFWDFVTISGSTLLSIPLMIVSESIQARYLGPDNYGKVALFIGAISLFYLFGMSWLKNTIMRFGKEEFINENHIRKTTGSFLLINGSCFVFIAIIQYAFKTPVLDFLEIKNPDAVWIILIGLVLAAGKEFTFEALKVVRQIKIQQLLFRLASKIFIVIGILFLAFILFDVRVEYVILVFLGTDALIILIGFIYIKKSYIFPLSYNSELIKKMVNYAFPLLFTSWSGYVVNWIDVYVIKYFMTLSDVGVYQAAYKIMSTLKSFWGAGLVTISTPIIMVFKTKNRSEKITEFYLRRLTPQISFFSMLIVAFVILFSDYILLFIYGEEFIASITPFKILVASINISAISYSILAIVTSFDMTKHMLLIGITTGLLNIIMDVLLVPYIGITGAAISSATIFSIGPVFWYFILNKSFQFNRPLVFVFPVIAYIILIINIGLTDSFILRMFVTVLLLFIGFILGRRSDLFLPDDTKLFANINMPGIIRNNLYTIIRLLAKK